VRGYPASCWRVPVSMIPFIIVLSALTSPVQVKEIMCNKFATEYSPSVQATLWSIGKQVQTNTFHPIFRSV
jgi:hypothetical protein